MIRRFLAPALVGLGACVILAAVGSATLWRPPDHATATATAKAPLMAAVPGVMDALADDVEIRIEPPDDVAVVAVIGRDTDVAAWIGASPATWLTGFATADEFATAPKPPDPTESAESERRVATDSSPTPEPDDAVPPAPAEGSDLWISSHLIEGEGVIEWQRQPGRWSLLIAPAGAAPPADASIAGTAVSMTWPRVVTTPFLVPGIVLGAVMLAAGVVLWVLLRRRRVASAEPPGAVGGVRGGATGIERAAGAAGSPDGVPELVPAGAAQSGPDGAGGAGAGLLGATLVSGPDRTGAAESPVDEGSEAVHDGAAQGGDGLVEPVRRVPATVDPGRRFPLEAGPAAAETMEMSPEAIMAAVEAGAVAGLTRRQIREAQQLVEARAKASKASGSAGRGGRGRSGPAADVAKRAPDQDQVDAASDLAEPKVEAAAPEVGGPQGAGLAGPQVPEQKAEGPQEPEKKVEGTGERQVPPDQAVLAPESIFGPAGGFEMADSQPLVPPSPPRRQVEEPPVQPSPSPEADETAGKGQQPVTPGYYVAVPDQAAQPTRPSAGPVPGLTPVLPTPPARHADHRAPEHRTPEHRTPDHHAPEHRGADAARGTWNTDGTPPVPAGDAISRARGFLASLSDRPGTGGRPPAPRPTVLPPPPLGGPGPARPDAGVEGSQLPPPSHFVSAPPGAARPKPRPSKNPGEVEK
ncbi:MAG: hypothetical protein LBH48_03605 [Bifidobacteriaceae bacterium]|nr:hypothetical protein [Bifidobacteriaceae bacterium]